MVSDVADVALAVDVVFTDVALDIADVALDVADVALGVADVALDIALDVADASLGVALAVADVALVVDTGGATAAGADETDEPQKSAPVPHLPFVEH